MVRSTLQFIFASAAIFVLACSGFAQSASQFEPQEDRVKVEITTAFGIMTLELFNETPLHRDNFVKLVNEGFYEGLLFHRVMKDFMIQGGDPKSKEAPPGARLGSGGPGYTMPKEIDSRFVHVKGALCAARQPDRVNPEFASSGSQFYLAQGRVTSPNQLATFASRITESTGEPFAYMPDQVEAYSRLGGTAFLDMNYTVFGQVTQGLEVIDAVTAAAVDKNNRPLEDVVMSIRVLK
jgi:peptidyl-prolyl cis-trans isomerase B (cyclophilin B)